MSPGMDPRFVNKPEVVVSRMYRLLSRQWGPQHWWPAETPFEVIVGAILTQNTSWTNVEHALNKLRQANALSVRAIRALPLAELEKLVRSSGYYRQKASRLKGFVTFLDEKYGGSLKKLFSLPTEGLRSQLLSLKGIGQETADAILLYAGKHEIFVVDAYARRVLERHRLVDPGAKYDEIRDLVERALRLERPVKRRTGGQKLQTILVHEPSPMSQLQGTALAQIYNEMHGLLVQVGKHYCYKTNPDCQNCPLRSLLPE